MHHRKRRPPSPYQPGARRDVDDLEGFLEFLAEDIQDAGLRALARAVLDDPDFRVRFRAAPMSVDQFAAFWKTEREKFNAVANEVAEKNAKEIGRAHV